MSDGDSNRYSPKVKSRIQKFTTTFCYNDNLGQHARMLPEHPAGRNAGRRFPIRRFER
jgi:hypothetical protein